VFGVPAAHEDDPERAVRAALRIVEDVGASDLPIQVRLGVNTGEALVRLDVDPRSGVGFATGDTMNTTARLEAAAPVMGVAVSERTYAATETAIAYEELEPIAAKGKAEPLSAWRALEAISRVVDERDHTPFVGREPEFTMLTQLFERSRTRPATEFATIVADPGLGKSRLVRELSRYVEDVPELVRWRVGRCLPYGEGIGFWALGEVVKAEAGILDSDDQTTLRSKLERAVTEPDEQTKTWMIDRLAPLVGMDTSSAAPEQTEAFTAWRRFLESLATQGPTVVVIEDLHWADPGFVGFLEHLAERTAGLPLLVVVTARPEVEERHPSWPPGHRSSVLSLSPLGDADVEALVRTSLPEASDELRAIVLERAGGSPLYAEQLAAMLHESSLPIAGGAIDEALIPQSVQALIAARIDALAPDAKQVLMQAAVVGKTFWSGAVASLGTHQDLDGTLGQLVRREFCRPTHPSTIEGDREFSFWHALVRDVAYAELTKAERARLHAGVATWIAERTGEAMGEEAEIVVHHLDRALELAPSAPELDTAPLTELLAEALLAAGEAAFRTDASAADHILSRALELLEPSSPIFVKASSLRGKSLAMAGRPLDALPFLEGSFQAMRMNQEFDNATELSRDLLRAYWDAGRHDDAESVSRTLLQDLGPAPSRAKASVLGGLSHEARVEGREEEARELCLAGLAICEELGLQPPEVLVGSKGLLRILRGDLEGEDDVRAAAERYLELGNPDRAAGMLWELSATLSEWIGAAASPSAEEAIELCSARGVGNVESLRILNLLSGLEEGRWVDLAEAEELAARAREAGRRSDESSALLFVSYVELERTGSVAAGGRLLELADDWQPEFWIASLGGAVLARSKDLEVRNCGLALLEAIANSVEADATWRFLFEEARAATAAGRPELARRLAPDLNEFRRPQRKADAYAAAGVVVEADGRWEEAASRYAEAAVLMEQLGYEGSLVGPLIGLGRCLTHLGHADEAVSKLKEARRTCDRLGAAVRITEIDQLLAAIGSLGGASA
jgi:tetratricopeptide (TPR) repeat protein